MKKRFTFGICVMLVICTFTTSFAQDDAKKEDASPWKTGGDASLTFLASGFSDSWSSIDGGQNNLTVGFLVNGFAKYKQDKVSWDNTLLAQYTTQRNGDADFVKTLDKLEALSFAGLQATDKWYYSIAASIKTQWTPTYTNSFSGQRDSVLSSFFAPGEILLGPGMKYSHGDKKSKAQITANISPATARFIIVNDQQVADANYNGENFRLEFGASILGTCRVNLRENVTYQTNVELFSNYLENPQFIDIKWANIISTNIFKIVTINFTFDVRYDKDISDDFRFANTFGVGLGYKF